MQPGLTVGVGRGRSLSATQAAAVATVGAVLLGAGQAVMSQGEQGSDEAMASGGDPSAVISQQQRGIERLRA